MSRVFWDTNLFVYLLEDKGELTDAVVSLRRRMIERSDELLTSTLTLGEILVKPIEVGNEALARRYEQAIVAAATVLAFDRIAAAAFRSNSQRPVDCATGCYPARLRIRSWRGHLYHQRPEAKPQGRARHPLHPTARERRALTLIVHLSRISRWNAGVNTASKTPLLR